MKWKLQVIFMIVKCAFTRGASVGYKEFNTDAHHLRCESFAAGKGLNVECPWQDPAFKETDRYFEWKANAWKTCQHKTDEKCDDADDAPPSLNFHSDTESGLKTEKMESSCAQLCVFCSQAYAHSKGSKVCALSYELVSVEYKTGLITNQEGYNCYCAVDTDISTDYTVPTSDDASGQDWLDHNYGCSTITKGIDGDFKKDADKHKKYALCADADFDEAGSTTGNTAVAGDGLVVKPGLAAAMLVLSAMTL